MLALCQMFVMATITDNGPDSRTKPLGLRRSTISQKLFLIIVINE